MSRGTRFLSFRCPDELRKALEAYRISRNERAKEAPWTMSDMILKALRDFLDHRVKRSRRKSKNDFQGTPGSDLEYEQCPQLSQEKEGAE